LRVKAIFPQTMACVPRELCVTGEKWFASGE
jgi:hypothetical protein